MEGDNISELVSRFEQMLAANQNIYFDADEYEELADYYEKSDYIEMAKKTVSLGLKIHPDNDELKLKYAEYLIYDNNYTGALKYLNTHFDSYNFDSTLLKIECLLQLSLYAEAHQLTSDILNDKDTDIDIALSELGTIYLEAEYFDEAILYLNKSIEYVPDNIEVLRDLIYAYELKGDFSSAIQICEQILDIDPYSYTTWIVLGKLYSLLEKYENAIDAFDFALTLDEGNLNALKLKAHSLILSGQYDEAIIILKQITDIDPDDEIVWLNLIDCYTSLEQYEQVLYCFTEYEKQFGESALITAKKASTFLLMGNIDKAIFLINEALDTEPDNYETNLTAAEIYFQTNQIAEAETILLKTLSLKEENYEALEKLVLLYIESNNIEFAIQYQEQLIEISDNPIYKEKLALLYLELGNKEKFQSYINSLEDNILLDFLILFYPNEDLDITNIERDYLLKRLNEIFESRILFKNIEL